MSEIRATTIAGADGTSPSNLTAQSAPRAVVSYDQTTPQVFDDLNVSSVTDNVAGSFTLNYTNNFSLADGGHTLGSNGFSTINAVGQPTTALSNIQTFNSGFASTDFARNGVARSGDLA